MIFGYWDCVALIKKYIWDKSLNKKKNEFSVIPINKK